MSTLAGENHASLPESSWPQLKREKSGYDDKKAFDRVHP